MESKINRDARPQHPGLTGERIAPPTLAVLALIVLWAIVASAGDIPAFILPSPTRVLRAAWQTRLLLIEALGATLGATFAGLGLAIVTGIGSAALLDLFPPLRRAFYPLIIASQTVQILAIAPLIVLWLGFGIGATMFVVTLFTFFPMTIATLQGLDATDPDYLDLLHSMHASTGKIWLIVRLPGALPAFFGGLRLSVTYSVVAATIGEWISGSGGLGIYMLRAKNALKTDQLFAGMLITTIISIGLFSAVGAAERLLLPWRRDREGASA